MEEIADAVEKHLCSFWGQPMQCSVRDDNLRIDVWADPIAPGLRILGTVGMSARSQVAISGHSNKAVDHRTEILTYAREEDVDCLTRLLSDLTRYPFEHCTCLNWWHLLPLGKPVKSGSRLDALLITLPPYDDASLSTVFVGQARVNLLWTIPITEAELAFGRQAGVDALESKLEEAKIDLADLRRASIM